MALEKLKQRNVEFYNSQVMGEDLNLTRAMAHNADKRLQLPLLFLEIPKSSRVKVTQDHSKMHLRLESNHQFTLRDENYLFHAMGLTKPTNEELTCIFDQEVNEFLKGQLLVEAPK